jgi:hypothetical protein
MERDPACCCQQPSRQKPLLIPALVMFPIQTSKNATNRPHTNLSPGERGCSEGDHQWPQASRASLNRFFLPCLFIGTKDKEPGKNDDSRFVCAGEE